MVMRFPDEDKRYEEFLEKKMRSIAKKLEGIPKDEIHLLHELEKLSNDAKKINEHLEDARKSKNSDKVMELENELASNQQKRRNLIKRIEEDLEIFLSHVEEIKKMSINEEEKEKRIKALTRRYW